MHVILHACTQTSMHCELGLAMEMQGLQLQQELLQVGGLYW